MSNKLHENVIKLFISVKFKILYTKCPLYPLKLTLPPPTSSGRSVGIVHTYGLKPQSFFLYTKYLIFLICEHISSTGTFWTNKYLILLHITWHKTEKQQHLCKKQVKQVADISKLKQTWKATWKIENINIIIEHSLLTHEGNLKSIKIYF
jgi:hypothetical protein